MGAGDYILILAWLASIWFAYQIGHSTGFREGYRAAELHIKALYGIRR